MGDWVIYKAERLIWVVLEAQELLLVRASLWTLTQQESGSASGPGKRNKTWRLCLLQPILQEKNLVSRELC